ncbi:hypothetical protein [Actinoallomurus iriomotensis]|nr:hypothetical protein [Actinoallomurus iriomotensis]
MRYLDADEAAQVRTTDDLGADEPRQAVAAALEEIDDWRWGGR